MKNTFLAILLLLATSLLSAQSRSDRIPSEKPELIVGIIIDQMRPDQMYRYWDKFGEDGFKKLLEGGTIMNQAKFNYLNTQPAPGYATIATGAQPAVHGIVSHEWYEILHDDLTHCTTDKQVQATGGGFEMGQFSPHKVFVSTIGDEIKLAGTQDNKVFSIGWRNECAIISGGHSADGVFWVDQKTGKWMSSSYYYDELPKWMKDFNNKDLADLYLHRKWELSIPIEQYAEYTSFTDDRGKKHSKQTYLPIDLKKASRISRKEKDYEVLRESPYGNTYILDLAKNLIHEENLGHDKKTDYLVVNLPAVGAVAHQFGRESIELEDVFLRLDKDIAHLLTSLEEWVGKNRLLVYVTAAHGMNQDVEYLKRAKLPAGRFDASQALSLLRAYLNIKHGRGNWVKNYYENQIYLDRALVEDSGLSLREIREEIAHFMIQFDAVSHTITSNTITDSYFPGGVNSLIQNGYNTKRSGDVMIVLRSGWSLKGEHRKGTGYNYDRKVPLIWYGWKIGRKVIYREVDMADIAPTLSYFLNIPVPDASTGKPMLDMLE